MISSYPYDNLGNSRANIDVNHVEEWMHSSEGRVLLREVAPIAEAFMTGEFPDAYASDIPLEAPLDSAPLLVRNNSAIAVGAAIRKYMVYMSGGSEFPTIVEPKGFDVPLSMSDALFLARANESTLVDPLETAASLLGVRRAFAYLPTLLRFIRPLPQELYSGEQKARLECEGEPQAREHITLVGAPAVAQAETIAETPAGKVEIVTPAVETPEILPSGQGGPVVPKPTAAQPPLKLGKQGAIQKLPAPENAIMPTLLPPSSVIKISDHPFDYFGQPNRAKFVEHAEKWFFDHEAGWTFLQAIGDLAGNLHGITKPEAYGVLTPLNCRFAAIPNYLKRYTPLLIGTALHHHILTLSDNEEFIAIARRQDYGPLNAVPLDALCYVKGPYADRANPALNAPLAVAVTLPRPAQLHSSSTLLQRKKLDISDMFNI